MNTCRSEATWTLTHLAGVFVLATLTIAVTHSAWSDIFALAFGDVTCSYIVLVPLVAAWLAWVRRVRWRQCRLRARFVGPVLVVTGWLLHAFGEEQAIEVAWHTGACIMLVGSVVSVLGTDVLRRFLPTFIALAFLIPVPGFLRHELARSLTSVTTQLTGSLAELFGVATSFLDGSLEGARAPVEATGVLRLALLASLLAFTVAFARPFRGYVPVLILFATPALVIASGVAYQLVMLLVAGRLPPTLEAWVAESTLWALLALEFVLFVLGLRLLGWFMVPLMRYRMA